MLTVGKYNSTMKHDDLFERQTGIFVFKGLVSNELCDELVQFHKDSPDKYEGIVGRYVVNNEVKKCIDVLVSDKSVHEKLVAHVNVIYQEVSKKYPILNKLPMTLGYPQIQRYDKGIGYFREHIDNAIYDEVERVLAFIYYLNDVHEGGETEFKTIQNIGSVKIKPEKGTVVVFPVSWKFAHEGHIPLDNDKYIVSQFMGIFFQDNNPLKKSKP